MKSVIHRLISRGRGPGKSRSASVGGRWLIVLSAGFALLLVAVTGLVVSLSSRDAVDRLDFIKGQVRNEFPGAPQLQTAALERWLEAGEAPVLLDVREADEYAVSHLPGAIRVDPKAEPRLPAGVEPGQKVVAYCSVGWRSSKWVEALRAQGVDAVNLEGSIFQWVAEERPLEREGETVDVVHPYSRAWAWLVDPEHRAFNPKE